MKRKKVSKQLKELSPIYTRQDVVMKCTLGIKLPHTRKLPHPKSNWILSLTLYSDTPLKGASLSIAQNNIPTFLYSPWGKKLM